MAPVKGALDPDSASVSWPGGRDRRVATDRLPNERADHQPPVPSHHPSRAEKEGGGIDCGTSISSSSSSSNIIAGKRTATALFAAYAAPLFGGGTVATIGQPMAAGAGQIGAARSLFTACGASFIQPSSVVASCAGARTKAPVLGGRASSSSTASVATTVSSLYERTQWPPEVTRKS
uniref:Uncharacterized protein n=1 Tax=Anopheles albimanus TaxID=7167 RepID=A0A182FM90_ANOAL